MVKLHPLAYALDLKHNDTYHLNFELIESSKNEIFRLEILRRDLLQLNTFQFPRIKVVQVVF